MKMYGYIVHDCSTPCNEFSKALINFHRLIRELIMGLSTDYAIFSVFSVEMYCYIVHDSIIP